MNDYIFNDNDKEVDELVEKIKSSCGIGVLLGWKLCRVCITRSIGILWIVYWGSLGFLVWWFYVAWVDRLVLFSCFVPPMFVVMCWLSVFGCVSMSTSFVWHVICAFVCSVSTGCFCSFSHRGSSWVVPTCLLIAFYC